jgi:hypothetical protein
MAAVVAGCAVSLVYLFGPIHRSSGADPAGIVSWATIGGTDPFEDYLWFVLAMVASVVVALCVLHVYRDLIRSVGVDAPPTGEAGRQSPTVRRAILLLIAVVALAWTVRASGFDPFIPIRDDPVLQSALPAGLRLDPFHDGERLGFLPAVLTSAQPFDATFFIHGFGVDVGPALVGHDLLPGLVVIVAMRLALIGQLALTCLASLWVVRELASVDLTRRPTGTVLAVGVITYALATRTAQPHLLLSIVQLALVIRGMRSVGRPVTWARTATVGAVLGVTLPLGLLYSYAGLVASVAMTGIAAVLVLIGRGVAGLGWILGVAVGAVAGLVGLTLVLGPAPLAAMGGQVLYWVRWGQAIWDRPPTLGPGPLDVILPALLAAFLIMVALIVWLAWSWYRRRSWRSWLTETSYGWVLLAYAAVGARDAVDRGGYDYGERAIAAASFGLAYLAMLQAGRLAGRPRPGRWIQAALVLGSLVVVSQSVLAVSAIRPDPSRSLLPVEFRSAPAALAAELRSTDCVYTLTSEGLWYFAFDRPSCSRFHQLVYARTDEAQAEVVAALARRLPPVIVYANETSYSIFDGLSPSSANATVIRWVLRHYRPARLIDGAWLWTPGAAFEGLGPFVDAAATIQLDDVQRGTEQSVTGALAGPTAEPGDAIYVTVDADSSPVAAGPIVASGDALSWTVRVPTFDLAPGRHRVGFWLARAKGGLLRMVATGALTVAARTSRPNLSGD